MTKRFKLFVLNVITVICVIVCCQAFSSEVGDITGEGKVDSVDLALMGQNWLDYGTSQSGDFSGRYGIPDGFINLYDFSALAGNWQSPIFYCYDSEVGGNYEMTLRTFAGIVNRHRPRLYVIEDIWDQMILDNLRSKYTQYSFVHLTGGTRTETRQAVFNNPMLKSLCSEMIVYDKDDSDLAILCAVTEAGRYGACIVEEAELSEMLSLGFTVKYDRRNYPSWSSNQLCQSWALGQITNYPSVYANDIFGMGDDAFRDVQKIRGVDYMVQKKMLVFLLDASNVHGTNTWPTQAQILSLFPTNSISYGWWSSEGPDVTALTQYRHTAMGHGNNVSFLSQFEGPAQYAQQLPVTVGVYNSSRKYCFISFSQGDALGFCQWHNLFHWTEYSQYQPDKLIRELYEFGMMHTPLQVDHQPPIISHYYETQADFGLKNVLFTGKGFGFNKPSVLYSNNQLPAWCRKASDYMSAGDLHDMMIADADITDNLNVYANIIKNTPSSDGWVLRSLITKNGLDSSGSLDDPPAVIYNTPVFGDPVRNSDDGNGDMDVAATANDIYTSMQNRQFFWVFLNHSTTARRFEQLMNVLNTDARFSDLSVMHPDKFIKIFRKHSGCGVFPTRILEDAFVKQDAPANNFGASDVLRVRSAKSSMQINSYLKFAVDNSGGTTAVSSAKLRVKIEDKDINGITVRAVPDNNWSQDTITYNTQPAVGDVLDQQGGLIAGTWVEFDVSSFVTAAPGVYSFILKTAQDDISLDIHSSEASDFADVPTLICDF